MQKFITLHHRFFKGVFFCLYLCFLFVHLYLRYSLPFPDYSSRVRLGTNKEKLASLKESKDALKAKVQLNKRFRSGEMPALEPLEFNFNSPQQEQIHFAVLHQSVFDVETQHFFHRGPPAC